MRPAARPDHESADVDRRLGGLVRIGVVETVDLAAGKAVVREGEALSPPLDWIMPLGDTSAWLAPSVGAQVLVLAPEGDPAQAVILGCLASHGAPPLFAGAGVSIRFKDGATLTYDPDASVLTFDLPGSVDIDAPGGVRIGGDLHVTGKLHTDDEITCDGDVIADDISLKDHLHGGVSSGSAKTGAPE